MTRMMLYQKTCYSYCIHSKLHPSDKVWPYLFNKNKVWPRCTESYQQRKRPPYPNKVALPDLTTPKQTLKRTGLPQKSNEGMNSIATNRTSTSILTTTNMCFQFSCCCQYETYRYKYNIIRYLIEQIQSKQDMKMTINNPILSINCISTNFKHQLTLELQWAFKLN